MSEPEPKPTRAQMQALAAAYNKAVARAEREAFVNSYGALIGDFKAERWLDEKQAALAEAAGRYFAK